VHSPLADAYLAALPDGLRSHPQCTMKASIMRDFAGGLDVKALESAVPPETKYVVHEHLPASSWVPEVHCNVVLSVMIDVNFHSRVEGFLAHAHARNIALLSSPLYRALFFVSSPERVLRRAGDRWNTLRRGSSLNVLDHSSNSARLEVVYPKNLLPAHIAALRTATFEDVITCAGAKDARVEVESLEAERAVFKARWR